jgi:hypothetical protein
MVLGLEGSDPWHSPRPIARDAIVRFMLFCNRGYPGKAIAD